MPKFQAPSEWRFKLFLFHYLFCSKFILMKKLLFLLLLLAGPVWAQTPEERIVGMGITLPEVRQPSAIL